MQHTSNINLAGRYSKAGAYLLPDTPAHHQLILHTRKQPTAKKPAFYIMIKAGDSVKYLSSLYPTKQPNSYILEVSGAYYTITLTDSQGLIREGLDAVRGAHCQCISLGNGCNLCTPPPNQGGEPC
jgi:hypothetical protein